MNDDLSRYRAMNAYKYRKTDNFIGTAKDLIGEVCKECFLAFKEFEFHWEENKILAEIEVQNEYERWKDEGCNNCERC